MAPAPAPQTPLHRLPGPSLRKTGASNVAPRYSFRYFGVVAHRLGRGADVRPSRTMTPRAFAATYVAWSVSTAARSSTSTPVVRLSTWPRLRASPRLSSIISPPLQGDGRHESPRLCALAPR